MKRTMVSDWLLNLRSAKNLWGELPPEARRSLKKLTERFAVSIAAGDLQFLERRWYITHAGLISLTERRHCYGISTAIQNLMSNPERSRWIFKATVYKTPTSKGFVGYGDADPTNVSPMVRGAEMRVAETRAVNRALRKAYGIGLCSVEELGARSSQLRP